MCSSDRETALGDFTALTATVASGTNVSYAWAFGDEDMGSGAVVTHSYPSAITYTAIVTASNAVSALTATTRVTITGAADCTTRVITYVYDVLDRRILRVRIRRQAILIVGNRKAMTTTAGTTAVKTIAYQYDAASRLISVGGSYTWDNAGNLTHDEVFTYTWNGAGRLVQMPSITHCRVS